jgi:nucleotide-binding universal stress UspA family protein
MKNVLVLMHDDAGQEARFQAALDLTRALDGHLTCVDVSVMPLSVGDYAEFGGSAMLMADEQAREKGNRSHMEARLKVEGVPYAWFDESGFLGPCVRDAAALADLVVLNRELDTIHYPDMRELVGEMLLKSGKPIVAVPQHGKSFDVFGNVLVAWDGSAQAEAALRAATPLMQLAKAVTILEINDGSLRVPATQAAEYLSRHGIKPVIRRESGSIDLPSTVILEEIAMEHPAYLVMGGFGHSRFVEAAFGGVTKRMLKECPVPLFLAH